MNAKLPAKKLPAKKTSLQKSPNKKKTSARKPPKKTTPSKTPPGDAAPKKHRIFSLPFATLYPLYVQKVEKKGRTKEELNEVIQWLTGYTSAGLQRCMDSKVDLETFFDKARMNPNTGLIVGVVCGVRVEEVEDPLMRKIRYLDKLVDELAQGRKMERILRRPSP